MSVGTGSAHMDRNQHALGLALRIEVRRLLTTRTWWVLGAMAVAVGGVITALTVAGSGESALPALDVFTGALTGGVQTSYLLTAIVGISAVASEHRHRTLTTTYLATPDRAKAIAAKLIVLLGYGGAAGIAIMAACAAIAGPWLAARGLLDGPLDLAGVLRAGLGGTAAIALMTAIGGAVGALVPNQVAALGGLMIYLFALEPSINSLASTRAAYPFLPGGCVQALTYTGSTAFGSPSGATLLHPLIGAGILAGYTLAIVAAAIRITVGRDVT